jgi:hypothetical protein
VHRSGRHPVRWWLPSRFHARQLSTTITAATTSIADWHLPLPELLLMSSCVCCRAQMVRLAPASTASPSYFI